jgi:chitodextrinase
MFKRGFLSLLVGLFLFGFSAISQADTEAPSVPENVSLYQATYTKVIIYWDESTDNVAVTGYRVFRDGVEIGTTTDLEFTETGLTPDTAYSYTVKAYDAAGNESEASIALSISTLEELDIADAAIVQQVVDTVDVTTLSPQALLTGIQNALALMDIFHTGFNTINGTLLDTMVQKEIDFLEEDDGEDPLTPEERVTEQAELDQVLTDNFGGHSFGEVYLREKLIELGESHWQSGYPAAAELLYEQSLELLSDVEPLVFTTLFRMGYFQIQQIPEDPTRAEIIARLDANRDLMMRFFDFFPGSTSENAVHSYISPMFKYFWYFPTLLTYDNYETSVFSNALTLIQAAKNIDDSEYNQKRYNRIDAWELNQLKIIFKKPDGTALTGSVSLRNVSSNELYPEDIVLDQRSFLIESGGEVTVPIYKGHQYDITALIDVDGGNPIRYTMTECPHANGLRVTCDHGLTPVSEEMQDPNATGEAVFISSHPTAPYNLSADILVDSFTLSWDWVLPDENYSLKEFKVFRGGVLIGTVTGQSLTAIPLESDTSTYTYTVRAYDVNDVASPESLPLTVLPDFTDDEADYYAWKTDYFGTDPVYALGDEDGDGLNNYHEYLLGSDPTVAPVSDPKSTLSDVTAGVNVYYYSSEATNLNSLSSLTPYLAGTLTDFNFAYTAGEILNSGLLDYVAMAFDGYLDVPTTGSYRFYLNSADGSKLYIDNKLVISNDGVHSMREYYTDLNLSAGPHVFRLEFFEYTGSAGLELDWAGPGFVRQAINSTQLWHTTDDSQVLGEVLAWQKDTDNDGLRDVEEVQLGTDPTLADTDGDSLTDYEEVRTYNTDPTKADSDEDGYSDYEELKVNFTDPNVADVEVTYQTVSSVYGSSATVVAGDWQVAGTAIYAQTRNGTLEYTISISPEGVYRLEVEGTQQNSLTSQDDFEIQLYIDGSYCGQQTLTAAYGSSGTAHFFMPSLTVGDHTAKLIWKNIEDETFLQINALRVQSISGTDADANGQVDLIDNRLENMCKITVPEQSVVSPICVEGDNALNMELISIAGFYTESGETPVEPTIRHGAENKWFADVPISPDANSTLTFSFQNGAETVQKTVSWISTNAITDDDFSIRLNDSLRLTGHPAENSAGTVVITVDGETYTTPAGTPVVHKFETAGTITVDATFTPDDGTDPVTGQLTVNVVSSSFSGSPTCYLSVPRSWDNPNLAEESVFEADSQVLFYVGDLDPDGKEIDLMVNEQKISYIVARLGEDGPIMDVAKITPITANVSNDYFVTIEEYDDGSQLVEGTIVLSEVPEDLVIYLRIFISGITFDDGTIERWVTADDFDENGVYRYRFIRAAGAYAGNCHYIKFYQDDEYLNKYF